jgi:hypothetical protein
VQPSTVSASHCCAAPARCRPGCFSCTHTHAHTHTHTHINAHHQQRAQVNISLVVDQANAQRAVKALHKEFFEGPPSCLPLEAGDEAPATPKQLAAAGAAASASSNGSKA